jgi:hypothetical protein
LSWSARDEGVFIFAGHVARQVILKDEFAMDYLEGDALKFLSKRERLSR